jgi:excisionase family DNA binding protein
MEHVTSTQAAKILGISVSSMRRVAEEGKISFVVTPGGHRRFDRIELARFQASEGKVTSDIAARLLDQLLNAPEEFIVRSILMDARSQVNNWSEVADMLGAVIAQIGKRWSEGSITVASEHIASHCIERAMSQCVMMPMMSPERFCILSAVEGEQHTLGLSLVQMTAWDAGWASVWLGAPTPTDVLIEAIVEIKPPVVAISVSSNSENKDDLALHIKKVSDACNSIGSALVIGGSGSWPTQVGRYTRLDSCEKLRNFLKDISKTD